LQAASSLKHGLLFPAIQSTQLDPNFGPFLAKLEAVLLEFESKFPNVGGIDAGMVCE
jgi:hypothetical protein